MRDMTHIVAILKLTQILPKMLPTDMDMRSVNPALQLCPETFNGIDARSVCGRIYACFVVDLDVAIAVVRNVFVTAKFIGVDGSSGQDVGIDKHVHRRLGARLDNARDQFTAAFKHPDNASLVALVSAAHAGNRTADQRFVNFDGRTGATKWIVTIKRRHVFADFMTHAPSRLVSHTKLALDFLGRNAVARSAEQEDDIEPIAQRRPRPMHRRVSRWKDLMAAKVASVRAPFRDRMEPRLARAFIADMRDAISRHHKMLQTSIFVRKPLLKLAQSEGFSFHTHYIAAKSPWRKGINTNLFQGLSLNK